MAHEVTMPQMGYDLTEGTINEWRLKEGDPVTRGDTIASIATDKADIDIEAYADGVLRKILVQRGQTVPVGTVIAWIGEPGEDVPDSGGSNGKSAEAPPPEEQPRSGSRGAERTQAAPAGEAGQGPEPAAAGSEAAQSAP